MARVALVVTVEVRDAFSKQRGLLELLDEDVHECHVRTVILDVDCVQ